MKKLLGKNEPAAVRILRGKSLVPVIITCDHASRRIPKSLGTLGVSPADRKRHIAYDHGTAHIGAYLSKKLGAAAVMGGYSRLVVDLNRDTRDPEIMRAVSDHVAIPGNQKLTAAERHARLAAIYHPYHQEIGRQIDRFLRRDVPPLFLAIHSLTPEMDGKKRPWDICVMWNREEKIARRLIRTLKAQHPHLKIGENKPYSLKPRDGAGWSTVSHHAEGNNLPYIAVEFRQDLVDTRARAEKWGRIFLQALLPLIDDPETFRRPVKKPKK